MPNATTVTATVSIPQPAAADPLEITPVSFDGAHPVAGPSVVELVVAGVNDTLEIAAASADFASTPPGLLAIDLIFASVPPPVPPALPAPSTVPIVAPDPWHVPDPTWP